MGSELVLEQRTCQQCRSPFCVGEFKKVVSLKNSGLQIYVYNNTIKLEKDQEKNKTFKTAFILHNASDRQLSRPDYIKEMCQYRTKCFQCRKYIERTRSLLDKISEIKQNEVIGVCEYCKNRNPFGICNKCKYMVDKFSCRKATQQHDEQELLRSWFYKVTVLLEVIAENKNSKDDKSFIFMEELENLLRELKSSLAWDERDILRCSETKCNRQVSIDLAQYKAKLEELFFKLKFESMKNVTKITSREIFDLAEKIPPNTEISLKTNVAHTKEDKLVTKTGINKQKPKVCHQIRKKLKIKKNIKAIKKRDKNTKQDYKKYQKKLQELPSASPITLEEKKDISSEEDKSFVICKQIEGPKEMIKGTVIVNIDPHYKNEQQLQTDLQPRPLFYKVDGVCPENIQRDVEVTTKYTKLNSESELNASKAEAKSLKGFCYKLSNPEFIDKGWTILPKLVKRIIVYKMEPASPQFDWFLQNKKKKVMYYNSGEKLAGIDDDGHGQWFYKNGLVALDFRRTKGSHTSKRYIVYSSADAKGKKTSHAVLAVFDYQGNGVVYDKTGNIRLKYNQFEGILYDEKVSPASRWRWHSFYDAAGVSQADKEHVVKNIDSRLQEIIDENEAHRGRRVYEGSKNVDSKIQNPHKEITKAHKFKLFKIRMKALKINDQFSLRIIDQTNIYLLFRDGQISLKLNIGMIMINSVVAGFQTGEASDVVTPYENYPPLF